MPSIKAFTPENVCRLTGLTSRQLRYWDKTGFFSPEYIDDLGRRRTLGRIYSFRDVVGLKVIGILRNQRMVPLQELRKVGAWLLREHANPWSSLRFGLVGGRRVVFRDPGSGVYVEPKGEGQKIFEIELQPIASSVELEADRLRERKEDDWGKVSKSRNIAHNMYVIAGTRIPTQAIWPFHEAGYSAAQILKEYPHLVPEDVTSAFAFEAGRKRSKAA